MRRRRRSFQPALLITLACAVTLLFGAGSHRVSLAFPIGYVSHSRPTLAQNDSAKAHSIRLGIISYWQLSSEAWDSIPAGSTVVINPNSGILQTDSNEPVQDSAAWSQLVDRLTKKSITVLGYVPTGYFTHSHCKKVPDPECQTKERIQLQVKTYYQLIPSIAGIF